MKKYNCIRFLTFIFFAMVSLPTWAQELINVAGKVVDNSQEPMIGVSIVEKGTSNGAVTDLDGVFKFKAHKGATLVISYIGYATQEVKAGSNLKITMKEDSKTLEDVVVVGYGVQKKSDVTGAISQVKAADMENRTITNAKSALQGKTAGVQIISSSAAPGSSPTVRIRGFSSNVGSEPLYVVDGVRIGDISGIDPNDIASMEILKDAASAAIYGAEAGNGVVLITTKKGKAGEGRIRYDFQFAGQSISRTPKMLNSEEYIAYMSEGKTFTKDYLMKNWDGKTNTNWIDRTFEDSKMTKHNIAFEGGSERGNYYLSLTYLDNDGIVKGNADVYKRLTATINSEYKVKNWLTVGTTNQIEKYNVRSVSSNNEYGSLLTSVMVLDPLTAYTYAPNELPSHMLNAQKQGKKLLTDADGNYYGISKFYAGEQTHPMIMRDNGLSRNSGFNVNGSIYANFMPFKGFTFTSRFGYRLGGARSSSVSLPFYGNAVQGNDYVSLSGQNSTNIYYQWENFANYMKQIGLHTVTGMVGMSYQESTS
ncbi:SusC/RagA family TonB-linked outer membrane protein, partial [Prevotella sp.]|uniref:SusC/RagA family TonB-linked outer membrane protein n=1 Tax=Prevotella sp. TaxID=59823 RepID=UPI002F923999